MMYEPSFTKIHSHKKKCKFPTFLRSEVWLSYIYLILHVSYSCISYFDKTSWGFDSQIVTKSIFKLKYTINFTYILLQKKCNFSEPIFPGDHGSLTLTPGHAHFVKWF